MRDDEMDDLLKRAGDSGGVDPALLDRVTHSIGASLRPVRPLPHPAVLAILVIAVSLGVGAVAAAILGMHGVVKMSAPQIGILFPALAALVCMMAFLSVREMIPGSRRRIGAGRALAICCGVLAAVLAFLFRDYQVERFWKQGMVCLTAGLEVALPAALLTWLVLRRGFAVQAAAAGLAQGMVAGLAGITMLELHCPNFQTAHILIWHIAVVPVSGLLAALVWGKIRR